MRSLRWSFLHLHFIFAVHIWFISYIINAHFFHGNIWTHHWPAPNVSGFIAQLIEHCIGNREVTCSNPVEVLNFFFQASSYNCINCVHCDDHFFIFISFPQVISDLFHISLTYGLYSYRPQKWCQHVQNSSGTKNHRQVVSLQSFEHFDVMSMVDKS